MNEIVGNNVMDEVEAREITNKIRQNLAVALVHIKAAWSGRAWIALGYESWNDYCTAEFDEYVKLSRGDRQDLVLELRDVGMSTRAIGSAIGVGNATVSRDLASAGVPDETPVPRHKPGDPHCWCHVPCPGFERDDSPPVDRGQQDDDEIDAEIVENPVVANNVIGLDGKTYKPTPAPKPARRQRFTQLHNYHQMTAEARRLANKLDAAVSDDRYAKHPPDIFLVEQAQRLVPLLLVMIGHDGVTS